MAKKDLFEVPPFIEKLDVKKLLHGIASQQDFETIKDSRSFIRAVNHPITKNMKSQSGPDIDSGDFGAEVLYELQTGWTFVYYITQGKKPAAIEISSPLFSDTSPKAIESQLTYQAQIVRTAVEVVDFLVDQGWKSLKIEDGTSTMKWAMWAYAKQVGLTVTGYQPDDFDKIRQENTSELFEKVSLVVKEPVPQAALSPSPGKTEAPKEMASEKDEKDKVEADSGVTSGDEEVNSDVSEENQDETKEAESDDLDNKAEDSEDNANEEASDEEGDAKEVDSDQAEETKKSEGEKSEDIDSGGDGGKKK